MCAVARQQLPLLLQATYFIFPITPAEHESPGFLRRSSKHYRAPYTRVPAQGTGARVALRTHMCRAQRPHAAWALASVSWNFETVALDPRESAGMRYRGMQCHGGSSQTKTSKTGPGVSVRWHACAVPRGITRDWRSLAGRLQRDVADDGPTSKTWHYARAEYDPDQVRVQDLDPVLVKAG